jgi:hypothetical protein
MKINIMIGSVQDGERNMYFVTNLTYRPHLVAFNQNLWLYGAVSFLGSCHCYCCEVGAQATLAPRQFLIDCAPYQISNRS